MLERSSPQDHLVHRMGIVSLILVLSNWEKGGAI